MRKYAGLLLLFCLCTGVGAFAQSYYFRHYQVEQGLSNNTVFCCAQDKRGFFWMGTKDGLSRFDGYSFKIFRNDPDDSTTLGDNFIRSLYIDADTLYAGTRNGLYRYNALMENFSLLYKTNEEIRDIKKDKTGNIWFAAGLTLFKLNGRSGQARVYDQQNYFAATSVCIDNKGKIWVSTATGLLERYDEANDKFVPFDLFANNRVNASSTWIEKIVSTDAGEILAGTSNYGVKIFNTGNHAYKDLLTYNEDHTGIFARDFVQVTDSEIWIATESGIFIYDANAGKVVNLKKQYGNPYSLSDNAVYSLWKDKEGGIWAGTYFGGINYYPRQYVAFEKLFPGYNQYSLSGNAVREICEDRYGNLWIGTEDAGLNKLDRKNGIITRYQTTGTSKGISYPNIHGLLARGDELWIGTFEHGLDVMDIRTGNIIRHYPTNSSTNELKSNFIVVISQAHDGTIYIGTRQGLYRFNNNSKDFEIVTAIPSTCFVHSIYEDSGGVMWVGTLGNGLFYYDPATGKKANFLYNPKNKKGLNSNSVTTIFESVAHELWIGTEGGGLCKLNRSDSSFRSFTLKDGFPSNTIFRILEDEGQQLWITTSNGLVSFTPGTGNIKVYTAANGLLSNQFNYNSGYKDREGRLYFGSAKGLVSFNPAGFTKNSFVPPVYITGLFINDNELQPGEKGSSLKTAIGFANNVTLDYNEASFSINFAALSFSAPEMTEYKYIMEGLDNDWTYLKANRKVYFTNLAPGSYTFRVKAANSNGVWTAGDTQLVIKVLPPFWKSPLAYFLYGLLAIAAVFFLVRGYHHRVKEKTRRKIEALEHEKEKEIYQAKINFFTNVAHEIKTPLTLIKAPMEEIARKAGYNSQFDYDLSVMQKNTDRLLELTNQLLDFRKIEATGFRLNLQLTDITELLRERYNSFKLLGDQKNISISLRVPESAVMAHVDNDSMQKILNNLLYNALNYCRRTVEIELFALKEGEDHFTIETRSDGNLIPVELREKIFEPFYRLRENAGKSGTGIGLALSRSLATLHKGSLYMKDTDGKMNIFVLHLPVHPVVNDSIEAKDL